MNINSLPSIKETVLMHKLFPHKSKGQHFIYDSKITDRIASLSGDLTNSTIYEVGPGPGGLTRSLLNFGAKKIIAAEKDQRCVEALNKLAISYPQRLEILHDDALTIDENNILPKGSKIISNLPFNISTALFLKWLDKPNHWSSMTLMFQKEVAQRLSSKHGKKSYGRLSVITQWLCNVEILFNVKPGSFIPPPKVTSSVISIIPRNSPLAPASRKFLEKIVGSSFNQRRKMLKSSLKSTGLNSDELLRISGVDPHSRADDISIEEYCALARALKELSENH